jgi:hypothetical protein
LKTAKVENSLISCIFSIKYEAFKVQLILFTYLQEILRKVYF